MRTFVVVLALVLGVASATEALPHDAAYYQARCDQNLPVDCVVTTGWAFGPCSVDCGHGTAYRSPSFTTRATAVRPVRYWSKPRSA